MINQTYQSRTQIDLHVPIYLAGQVRLKKTSYLADRSFFCPVSEIAEGGVLPDEPVAVLALVQTNRTMAHLDR